MSHCRLYVRPTHLRDPHDFYVRPVSHDTWLESFQKRIAEIETPEEVYTASAPPQVGELVLLQHDKHSWVRGRVSELHRGTSNVYTVDYGETLYGLRPDQLRRYTPSEFDDPLSTVLYCRMRYCEPPRGNAWSFAGAAAFLSYIGHDIFIMTVVKRMASGQLEVELENELGETVSDLMVATEAASFANDLQRENRTDTDCSETEPSPLPPYSYDSLQLGIETDMRVISVGEGVFQAVRMERYMGFRSMSDSISVEFGDCQVLGRAERAEGSRVVCRVRGCGSLHYYRGSIVQVDPVDGGMHRAHVRLLDFGESRILPVHTLRRSKPYLIQEPVFAVSCRLVECQLCDDGLRSLLRSGTCIAVKAEKAPESDGAPHIVSIVKVFAGRVIHF